MSDSRVALVTGATSGIGRETATLLAERGWTVLVHGRDEARGRAVCETIDTETAGDATFYHADLADFEQVGALADAVADDHDRLDVLLNNAGTWQGERRLTDATAERSDGTGDRVELTMAVNHCAHYRLTHDLWSQVAAADGRLVTVSSSVHSQGTLDTDRFVGPDGPAGQQAYADSKLANLAFTRSLGRRADGVSVTACHPGVVPSSRLARDTQGLAKAVWTLLGVVGGLLPVGPVVSERTAAGTSVYLATTDDDLEPGGYYADSKRADAKPTDEATERHLWEWTADAVGVDPSWPPA